MPASDLWRPEREENLQTFLLFLYPFCLGCGVLPKPWSQVADQQKTGTSSARKAEQLDTGLTFVCGHCWLLCVSGQTKTKLNCDVLKLLHKPVPCSHSLNIKCQLLSECIFECSFFWMKNNLLASGPGVAAPHPPKTFSNILNGAAGLMNRENISAFLHEWERTVYQMICQMWQAQGRGERALFWKIFYLVVCLFHSNTLTHTNKHAHSW